AADDGADRSRMPSMGPVADLALPAVQEGRLSNGVRVVHVERESTPTVELVMTFDAGGAADRALKPGLQNFAVGLMDDGSGDLDGQDFARAQGMLGARIYAYSDVDTTNFALSALTRSLEDSVALWASYVREPAFDAEDVERERGMALSGLQQARVNPDNVAGSLFSHLLYGPEHAYGGPLEGREEVIASYDRDDLIAFHQGFIRPDHAVIFASGAVPFDALMEMLEANFGDWRAPGEGLASAVPTPVEAPAAPRVILVDKPGAIQSVIRVGQVTVDGRDPRSFDLELLNGVLGGGFTSRLNMNLREEKGWTYGANSYVSEARGPRVFAVSTSIQTDRTAEAL